MTSLTSTRHHEPPHPKRGNLVTDAHLAALAIEHGTSICSFDSDFARFPGVQWISPNRV